MDGVLAMCHGLFGTLFSLSFSVVHRVAIHVKNNGVTDSVKYNHLTWPW